MAIELLHPQDCFFERLRSVPRSHAYPNPSPNSRPHRRSVPRAEPPKRREPRMSAPAGLRRGQVADFGKGGGQQQPWRGDRKKASSFEDRDLSFCGGRQLPRAAEGGCDGRDDLLMCDGVYAGSGFSQSPAPSLLPLPTFSTKRASDVADASEDLRRLLRIGSS